MTRDYSQGWTGAIQRALYDETGGVLTAVTGTSKTVTLELLTRGRQTSYQGTVAWLDQTAGTVTYSPHVDDLKASESPYRARWAVTDASGKVIRYPDDAGEEWKVWP